MNPQQPNDSELREKIGKEFDNFSYAVMGEYASDDMPERIDNIMQLIKADRETAVREARIAERDYVWKLVNDIRYENITLNGARDETLDRLTAVQVEQDLAQLNQPNTNKEIE